MFVRSTENRILVCNYVCEFAVKGLVMLLPLINIYWRSGRGRESVKGKDGIIQLLDYALERFDFEDKKG